MRRHAASVQTERDCLTRENVRVVHVRLFATQAPREALLFGGRHELTIDDESGGGFLVGAVDAKDPHRVPPRTAARRTVTAARGPSRVGKPEPLWWSRKFGRSTAPIFEPL